MQEGGDDKMSELPRHSLLTIAGLWIRRSAGSAVTILLRMSRQITQDFRYSLRLWARRPSHTGFAILALAIGIGANTGVFSVVNALLLRSLPFHDPSRLASLGSFFPPHGSAKDFHEWRQQQSSYLADAALVEETDLNFWGGRAAERAHVSQASWNFFSTLGIQPALGRGFLPGEDTPGQNAIAVVSFGLWQEYFAGDQRILGSIIRINDVPLTIVGVAPRGFDYPNGSVLWKAAAFSPGNNGWETIARLKSGITWPRARSAFAVEADRLWPQRNELGNTEHFPNMTSLQDALAGPVKNASLMLMAGVVLILLIACANVANLLMARTWDRAAELSIRSALGASRARLAQQLLTECLLLSFVSAGAGLLLASWTTSIAARLQPPPLASQSFSILDGRVLGFVALASILSCALFGVLPSLYAGRTYLFGTRSSAKAHGSRLIRESLVAAQIMLTIILLTASVSVARAFINLMSAERGFDVKALATVSVSLEGTTRQGAQKQLTYLEEVLDRIRRIPGVRYASATQFLPLYSTGFVGGPFTIDGRPFPWNSTRIPVLSDYFQTMGGRILYGREFTEAEVRSGSKVAVINERFASEFGAPADALGRQLTSGNNPPRKIIGIVKGINYVADPTAGWRPTAETREVYVPASEPSGFRTSFVVRVNGRAEDYLGIVRDTIRSVDDQVPIFGVKTMEQRLDEGLIRPNFYRTSVLFFAGFALLLAVIGIYGIVSYAVGQRTKELGVRLVLGAMPARLRGNLLARGLLTILAGAIPGLVGARFTGRLLESLIYGAKSVDLATSIFTILLIAAVASTSIWVATRRIATLDIMETLRDE
jgi:putative ABC transport system permease protein